MLLFPCTCSDNGWPISLDMACNKALSAVACSFEFTNNANEDLYLLKRNTPLEGLHSPFIDVTHHSKGLVPYSGIVVFRIPIPEKNEFVLLKAGESISTTAEITDIFKFDTDGLYTVQYSKPLQYLPVNAEMSAQQVPTDELWKSSVVAESADIYLTNTQLLTKPQEPEIGKVDYTVQVQGCASASFIGGNAQNNNKVLEAHKRICGQMSNIIDNKINQNALYRKWFGVYTPERAKKVKATYQRMETGLSSGQTVTYSNNGNACHTCRFAYTHIYEGQPYDVVYLCSPFYTIPINCMGTEDTMENVLVHEWAHALGWTKDIRYGSIGCQFLAYGTPDKAIINGDSYGYHYCESYNS